MSLPTNTWISIKDTLPPKSDRFKDCSVFVDITDGRNRYTNRFYDFKYKAWSSLIDYNNNCITHFMIIELPK